MLVCVRRSKTRASSQVRQVPSYSFIEALDMHRAAGCAASRACSISPNQRRSFFALSSDFSSPRRARIPLLSVTHSHTMYISSAVGVPLSSPSSPFPMRTETTPLAGASAGSLIAVSMASGRPTADVRSPPVLRPCFQCGRPLRTPAASTSPAGGMSGGVRGSVALALFANAYPQNV